MTNEFQAARANALKAVHDVLRQMDGLWRATHDTRTGTGRETFRKAIEDGVPTHMQVALLDSALRELLEAWPSQGAELPKVAGGELAAVVHEYKDSGLTAEQLEEAFSRR